MSRTLPNRIFEQRVSVNTVKFEFKKSFTRKEATHIVALKKA